MIIGPAITRQSPSQRLVCDQLWILLELLIPQLSPAKNGRTGRPRVKDRVAPEVSLVVTGPSIVARLAVRTAELRVRATCWRGLRTR